MPTFLIRNHCAWILCAAAIATLISASPIPPSHAYTAQSLYALKGIWTDFWQNRDEIANNGVGAIAVNAVWQEWDKSTKTPPCSKGEEEYAGECFKINTAVNDEIKFYSEKNIDVYAVLYGVPERFRIASCSPINPYMAQFCAPKEENLDAFSRFVGMLAARYDGAHGNGKITDFVIGNEVNRNEWYDNGCGAGTPCDFNTWVSSYAHFFNAAYDAIARLRPSAKVFISLDHAFNAAEWDRPRGGDGRGEPSMSTQTFLTLFAQKTGGRTWRVAYHPYNTDLFNGSFNADDGAQSGMITMGNIGMLAGWLATTFPNNPEVYQDIKLTESGFHSGETTAARNNQAQALCNSSRNVLGTPGITSYIYQRMKDHPDEGGLLLGLHNLSGAAKPAWNTWALMNRPGINLDCGFEDLPFTRLTRGYNLEKGHWASSRLLPPNFTAEFSWKLTRSPSPTEPMKMLYECGVASHAFISTAYDCEGTVPRGPVGYAYANFSPRLTPLYRCFIPVNGDHFVSSDPKCEGWRAEQLLGYAYPPDATAPFIEPNPQALLVIPSSNKPLTIIAASASMEAPKALPATAPSTPPPAASPIESPTPFISPTSPPSFVSPPQQNTAAPQKPSAPKPTPAAFIRIPSKPSPQPSREPTPQPSFMRKAINTVTTFFFGRNF